MDDVNLYAFASCPLTREPQRGKINEIDYYLWWTRKWGDLTVEPGLTLYTCPHVPDSSDTVECGLTLSRDFGHWKISTSHGAGLIASPGYYYGDLTCCWEQDLSHGCSLKSETALAWPSPVCLANDITLTRYVCGGVYISPHVGMSMELNGDVAGSWRNRVFAYGVGIGTEY